MAIGMPPINHQIRFIRPARQPDGQPPEATSEPKGHSDTAASFMVCRPNGMPMIVNISVKLDKTYSMAIIKPPHSSQIIFSSIFIMYVWDAKVAIFCDTLEYLSENPAGGVGAASGGLEIEYRPYDGVDADSVAYVGYNLPRRLVDHRRLVACRVGDGLGIDTLH